MKPMLAALACLALFAGACGSKSQLDTSKLEGEIQKGLAQRTGIAIKTVDCPSGVEPKKGDRFTCTATTARNERVVVRVTQDDSKGAVTWKLDRPSGS